MVDANEPINGEYRVGHAEMSIANTQADPYRLEYIGAHEAGHMFAIENSLDSSCSSSNTIMAGYKIGYFAVLSCDNDAARDASGYPVPDFALGISDPAATYVRNAPFSWCSWGVTIQPINDFGGVVDLTLNAPAGWPGPLNWAVPAGNSISAQVQPSAAEVGTYGLTLVGQSGGLQHSAAVTCSIVDYSVTADPIERTIKSGGSAVYQLTINKENGFPYGFWVQLGNLWDGVTVTFDPQTVLNNSAATTMTVTTSKNLPAGRYPIMVDVQSYGLAHRYVTVVLIVETR
ncbi:MAG TPA: hypothetical protein VN428_21065 [Bryobacteraceae bacterium]|nr:hypothetical protein [Bryobacteraceae bacterium]